jgi:flavin reductase (DIM6/NTAB) family NADH-FMN oxidoreductase RutF
MSDDPATREYRTGSDPRTLRDALGCFATGVTVVTCIDEQGQPVGLTANSFTSLSLDPPLLLVCVAKASVTATSLTGARHFAVNVLQTCQRPASITFSTRVEDRFGQTEWTLGDHGAPVLMDSLSVFECRRNAVHDGGDHLILVGEVIKASFEPGLDPLLYFRGSYRRLHFD